MRNRFTENQQGGIVLEAALILPLFLVFVLAIIMFIQIALMEFVLQAAVSETTKSIAGQLYPARLVIQEAKARVDQSKASAVVRFAMERVQTARSEMIGAEQWVDDYASFIPDPIIQIIHWEKEMREQGEETVQTEYERILKDVIQPKINAAFTPIVYAFADRANLKKDKLKVTSVTLPGLDAGGSPYFGLEAQLEFNLSLPFLSRTLLLKKRAYERAWFGAA